jgi:hypothetical protein
MTKNFVALCTVLVALPLLAQTPETIIHDVQKDKIVRSGVVHISTKNILADTFTMEIKYKIFAKWLWIEKNLEGITSIDLPTKYLNPYGYEELENAGSLTDEQSTLTHLGRVNLPNHYDCHKVKIRPARDNKWSGVFTYCPDIPSIGFARTEILMTKIPLLGSHRVYTRIRE